MRRLRTTNEFMLKVLIYRGFYGIFNVISLSLVCVQNPFSIYFCVSFSLFAGKICPKTNADVFEQEMQKRPPTELLTVRRACDGL